MNVVEDRSMHPIVTPDVTEDAIFRTLLYADVFSFPLTQAEIHHFLIGLATTRDEIAATLNNSRWLAERIEWTNGYCTIHGASDAAKQRRGHDAASQQLWQVARRYGIILAHLPFVRMVALTGALSMRNASGPRDDIDYMIVTAPGRVWITRALVVLVVRLARLRGVDLCPNYVLAETAMFQEKHDLFIAHELAQMVPLCGQEVYWTMRQINEWAVQLLPNASQPFYQEPDRSPHGLGLLFQRIGELFLRGPLGNFLERWEHHRKQRKFQSDLHKPGSTALLDEQQVKGHFNDHGSPIMERYRARLQHYALPEQQPTMIQLDK